MGDVFSKEKRSEVMSRIRGQGNLSTEVRMISLFREFGINGWRRHQQLPGRPDFVFHREKVVVFVDGCFWHGCPQCYREPLGNRQYWIRKLQRNRHRDSIVTKALTQQGWQVVRIWECELRKTRSVLARIKGASDVR
jgi:DNA mismatch endonuclease (patch repair protein)